MLGLYSVHVNRVYLPNIIDSKYISQCDFSGILRVDERALSKLARARTRTVQSEVTWFSKLKYSNELVKWLLIRAESMSDNSFYKDYYYGFSDVINKIIDDKFKKLSFAGAVKCLFANPKLQFSDFDGENCNNAILDLQFQASEVGEFFVRCEPENIAKYFNIMVRNLLGMGQYGFNLDVDISSASDARLLILFNAIKWIPDSLNGKYIWERRHSMNRVYYAMKQAIFDECLSREGFIGSINDLDSLITLGYWDLHSEPAAHYIGKILQIMITMKLRLKNSL